MTSVITRTTASWEGLSTGPVLIPRKPAAYLTYNTLSLDTETSKLPANIAPDPVASPTHPNHQESEYDPMNTLRSSGELTPTIASKSGSRLETGQNDVSDPAPSSAKQPDAPIHSGSGFENIGSAIAGLASQASASREKSTSVASVARPEDNAPDGNAKTQTVSAAGIANLWSAIQSIASLATASQGPVSTLPPGVDISASNIVSQQHGDDGNTEETNGADADAAKTTEHTASATTANEVPIFTILRETLSPGGAATFGGSPVSELSSHGGVVIGGSHTVHVSDAQATTILQDGHEPITISRSGSVFIVNDQTLSPGQQITAGRTTASLAQSTAVLYVNGAPTTLAGPSITLGGTVYDAAPQSAPASSISDGGLGGYIYSGIGGSAATESSNDGNADATGATPFTGTGSRLDGWIRCGWVIVIAAFWLW